MIFDTAFCQHTHVPRENDRRIDNVTVRNDILLSKWTPPIFCDKKNDASGMGVKSDTFPRVPRDTQQLCGSSVLVDIAG